MYPMIHFIVAASLLVPSLQPQDTRPPAAPTASATIWRSWNIADLTGHKREAELGQLVESAGIDDAANVLAASQAAQIDAINASEILLSTIRSHAEPPLNDASSLRIQSDGVLLLRGSPENAAWIERFLDIQRTEAPWMVAEAGVFAVPSSVASGFNVPLGSHLVSTKALEELKVHLFAQKGIEQVYLPRVIAMPRQSSSFRSVDEIKYIKDYELVVVQPGNKQVTVPIIGSLNEGMSMDLHATPLGTNTHALAFTVEHAAILRPIGVLSTTLGGHLPEAMEITLPETRIIRFKSSLTVGLDEGLLHRTGVKDSGLDYFVILRLKGQLLDEQWR